ncbi:GGDEF domain-containing protein [Azohydromonas aeria]|uniref:GGDEF domain-containing protein n=1 Tax=Azohydromonas aeria TaxID=2590212 RepID=UPI0012F92F5A|nr:GGDEF domain-containing protein [Azohydromonas aeria]
MPYPDDLISLDLDAVIQALAHSELLKDAPPEVLRRVQDECVPMALPAGELLLSPQHENQHVYVLLSGLLGLHFEAVSQPEVRELTPGSSVGEMSVLDDAHPRAYVVAKEDSLVLPLHRELVLWLIDEVDVVARNLLRLMTRRRRRHDTQPIARDQERLFDLANDVYVDALTGVYNRRWLDLALTRLLQPSSERDMSRPLTVLLIDADFFKDYNDHNGHLAGDRALVALSETLRFTLRLSDVCVRYGGEEFLVLLPNTEVPEARAVAERVRRAVQMRAIAMPDGTPLPGITVSIGLASSEGLDTPEAVIAAADAQLYQAKHGGRNRVCP